MTAPVPISDATIDRVAAALGDAPRAAYTAPLVFPWSVRHFRAAARTERPRPSIDQLRLYVHVPFCRYHCTFCFYAVRAGAAVPEMERYVAALTRELAWIAPGTTLSQLFVGGGTPTALPAALLAHLLAAIFARMTVPADHVHTVEASPDSIDEAHLTVLREHGVGRVSMGVESLDGAVLDTVQRRHSAAQALDACRMIVKHGLLLNADLIYGLPGQTEASFRRDLEAVAAAGVSSLCLYALRLNESTPVAGQLDAAERLDLARLMRWRAFVARAAAEVGFTQVRGYAFERHDAPVDRGYAPTPRPQATSDQLGVGSSARSQLGDAVYRNHAGIDAYMQRIERDESPVETVFQLDLDDRKTQLVASTLGNGAALERAAYAQLGGDSLDADYGAVLARLRDADLIDDDGARITLTATGTLVYDRVLLCFYPERARRWLGERSS